VPGTPWPVKLHAIFTNRQTGSAMDGASFLCKVAGEFYEVKLAGKNCMEAFFPAFQGSAIAPLPAATRCAGPSNRA